MNEVTKKEKVNQTEEHEQQQVEVEVGCHVTARQLGPVKQKIEEEE